MAETADDRPTTRTAPPRKGGSVIAHPRRRMLDTLLREIPWPHTEGDEAALLRKEWLVTNALGGYASGTVMSVPTRRYHGLLISALPSPLGRIVMLNHLTERVRFADGRVFRLDGEEFAGHPPTLHGGRYLSQFRLEAGLPVWRYEIEGVVIEKRLLIPHEQNTVHVGYALLAGADEVRLRLRPCVQFRPHEAPVSEPAKGPYMFRAIENRYELDDQDGTRPPLRMMLAGRDAAFTLSSRLIKDLFYRVEHERGYESVGNLWSPGYLHASLTVGESVVLVASTEEWDTIHAIDPYGAVDPERERRRRLIAIAESKARTGVAGELVFAADQFIITPAGRAEEAARARATGDEVRTVIAGYHWFTDWGRDTMISLEGLALLTGRHSEAGYILRTFGHYIRDGLIPNMFPEGEREGLYNTADATLWFFHAIQRYVEGTGDRMTLRLLLPKLRDIVKHHLEGTRFHIHVDPKDGLLWQGEEGYQLTWMDAKVGDWVVTPRRGKAVEINALWYNALRLLERWLREEEGEAAAGEIAGHAERAYQAFNDRFWYAKGGYLYDVVDTPAHTDDPSFRPNQVFAISLDHPVLHNDRWAPVLHQVKDRLLTPVGLRSLAPGSPDYKPTYAGDLRSRDAAYHQGTVWAWLIGPFVDAWLRVHPDDLEGARGFLAGFPTVMSSAGVGTISEIFDAEAPYTPRGCVAQAWSVAEVLRAWVKTARG